MKLVVTPVFVLDDGAELTEQVGQQFSVAAKDVNDFPVKFFADLEKAQESLTGEQ